MGLEGEAGKLGAGGAGRRVGTDADCAGSAGAAFACTPEAAGDDGTGANPLPGATSPRCNQSIGASPMASSAPIARYQSSTAASSAALLLSSMSRSLPPSAGNCSREVTPSAHATLILSLSKDGSARLAAVRPSEQVRGQASSPLGRSKQPPCLSKAPASSA